MYLGDKGNKNNVLKERKARFFSLFLSIAQF